jgi:beta-lactamase regulating signal transducer with metallopeptidase domain
MIPPDPIAQTVLAILARQSFYALVLFPLIWAMVKCRRGRYPRWQHALWLLVLLRLLLPPDMAAPWSASRLIRSVPPRAVPQQNIAFPTGSHLYQGHQNPTSAFISGTVLSEVLNPSWGGATVTSRWVAVPTPAVLKSLRLVVFCTYFTIVTSLLVLFLRTRRRYRKFVWRGETSQDPAVLTIVNTWRRRLHIHRAVKVKTVISKTPAYTIRRFRPVIILPEHLIASSGHAALESILAHELVHVKRWDDLAICLQELVKIVYFFHPVVWFAMSRLRWTREAICDGTVLFHGTLSPRAYGQLLIAFGRNQSFREQSSRRWRCSHPLPGGWPFASDTSKRRTI